MKIKDNPLLTLLFLLLSISSKAQINDTVSLSMNDFLRIVKENHPIAKQADLIIDNAMAAKLAAKGNFDPKLFYDFRNKFYNSTDYYSLGNGGLTLPTYYGVDFKIGYENNNGVYLNPENSTSMDGLMYSQISVPLLQGLLIDERRATLKKAEIFKNMSAFEKANTLNELLFNAGKAYLNWQFAFANLQILQNSLFIAQQRFEAVKASSDLGDRPFIDTVEAAIQLQERKVSLQQAQLDYKTQSLILSNYLWKENDTPILLTDKVTPEVVNSERLNTRFALSDNIEQLEEQINGHPTLKIYEFKLQQLEIDKRLRKDKLKPNLNVNYNPLFDPSKLNNSTLNNYKWGLTLGFPLLLRKERGDFQMAKIRIENTRLENSIKRNELLNKAKTVLSEIKSYRNQYDIYSNTVKDYERLWKSEKQLFESGESSLFLINSREMNFINAQLKLNDLFIKNNKALLEANYAIGQLNNR